MDLAHAIVAKLLNEEHFDVHEHPELYEPLNKVNPAGFAIMRVCNMCEAEFGADKQYPLNVVISHGLCRRHAMQQYMQYLGYTPEQAEAKVPQDAPPDWKKSLQTAGTAPKATFWATSGSGDY
jgi:hypothetical protein